MRKYALVLILILLTGLMAGCISSSGSTTTSSESLPSETQTLSPTTTSTSTTTTPTETPTSTETSKRYDILELLQAVSEIKQFTYVSNATISMVVTVEQEGITQKDHVNLSIVEEGYMDFESWSAWINSTTVSMPDGASTNFSQVIVGNVTYIRTIAGWIKTDDSTTSKFLWEYNLVSLARKYLTRDPDEREEGDVLTLIYYLRSSDLEPLARMYFATTPDTEISVDNGILELYFKDGELVGGKISYTVSSKTVIDDPMLGTMTITQEGSWNEVIEIKSINEKKSVKEPST
ncbi:hypothetical protein TON_1621 [Thermococcus onnurineus NA1]|uniref:Uncharacterized protein n=1 Tax=Thermococcus onnurineus (strain NA1) TaxID=523850 RepID=B6YUC6_THEON|nr:hypothetical protein [Thermococcus onnurineus]ACJ17111.1 hypothetical protein TON_1621 [Thermococcus onnurineus NA1]